MPRRAAIVTVLAVLLVTPLASAQVPNVRVAISRELANLAARQTLDRCDRLDEVILGTRIRGLGRTIGAVHFEFVPDGNAAVIELVMSAVNIDMVNTIGTNGPVTIVTNGTAQLGARKRLFLTADGISSWPATADAQPTADLLRIDSRLHSAVNKVVRRVATNIYYRDQDKGLAAGRAIAIEKLTRGFDEDASPRLAQANVQLARLREQLREQGMYPQAIHLSTDSEYLHLLANVVDPKEPAAIELPPALAPGTHLAGWLHESCPNAVLARLLGGKKFTGEELNQEIGKLLGPVGPMTPARAEPESFAIQFAEKGPISLAFRDGAIGLTIRSNSFTAGETIYEGPLYRMNTTVQYTLKLRGAQVVAERTGELEVLPPDWEPGKRLSFRQQSLRILMRKRLERYFPARFQVDSTMLTPASFTTPGRLALQQIVSERGWLAGGVQWIPPVVN
jgi:hypothetical protein